jgi:hypothetical protein
MYALMDPYRVPQTAILDMWKTDDIVQYLISQMSITNPIKAPGQELMKKDKDKIIVIDPWRGAKAGGTSSLQRHAGGFIWFLKTVWGGELFSTCTCAYYPGNHQHPNRYFSC